jgi:hypothetical protein
MDEACPKPRYQSHIGIEIIIDGTPPLKQGQKKEDMLKLLEENSPEYNHIRTFRAIATAILSAEPGTTILSMDGEAPELSNVFDIPTGETIFLKYYESPMIAKNYIYHARIILEQ